MYKGYSSNERIGGCVKTQTKYIFKDDIGVYFSGESMGRGKG